MYYGKFVRQVGYPPELYQDGRSEKYIKKKFYPVKKIPSPETILSQLKPVNIFT